MGLTLGVDIGGTKTAAGVVDDAGNVLTQERVATAGRGARAVEEAVCELATRSREHYEIEAVGMGVAGFVDQTRSSVMFAPNLGWQNEPMRTAVEAVIGLPVVVENDASAAAWAEFRFGSGRGTNPAVTVTVGTGIGGGIVIDGRLYRGRWGAAAEFGHMNIEPGGRPCACGNRGCWEQYASGSALVREARWLASERRSEAQVLLNLGDGTPEGVQGKHVTEAARVGDPVALAAFDFVAVWLGKGLADLTAALDPECFVIGGGVGEAQDVLMGPTVRAFNAALSAKDHRHPPTIVAATLGNTAGMIGAADLARSA